MVSKAWGYIAAAVGGVVAFLVVAAIIVFSAGRRRVVAAVLGAPEKNRKDEADANSELQSMADGIVSDAVDSNKRDGWGGGWKKAQRD